MAVMWAVLSCITIFALVFGFGWLMTDPNRHTGARLRDYSSAARGGSAEFGRAATPAEPSDMMPTVGVILKKYNLAERLQVELHSAGISLKASEFVGIIISIAVILQFVAVGILQSLSAGIIFALLSAIIPIFMVKMMKARRRIAFDAQIPDALNLLASSLKSGFSFLRGMQMIAQEMPPPIAQEFKRAIDDVSIGKPLDAALRDITARIESYDIDLVVTAVEIHLSVGGNLAEILETISTTIHERNKVLGELRALTAEGTLSGAILVALPLLLAGALVVLNPEYMRVLIDEPMGPYLIGVAILLQLLGVIIIKGMLVLDI